MRTRVLGIAALLLLIPALTSGAAFGFPRQPLWVSSTKAQEGESITMYAAVYNATDVEMKGTLSFLADGTVFDTKSVDLPAGRSTLMTSAWNAVKGSHILSAKFESGNEKDTADKITVTVTAAPPPPPPPPPTAIEQTIDTTKSVVDKLATPSSPVAKVANAVLNQTEKLRTAGADFLEPYARDTSTASVASSRSSAATSSIVSGFTKSVAAGDGKSLLHAGIQTAAAAALYAFNIKWLFYVLLIVILFLILRALKRWVNRPRF